jgi:hypothetical protein
MTPYACHPEDVDPRPHLNNSAHQVVYRAFLIAAETGERCRPVHLLAALAEIAGPIADALRPPGAGPLFPRVPDPPKVHGGGASYLCMQTQQAARDLAIRRGETEAPEHLFLAVIDQAEPEAVALLAGADLDLGDLRKTALEMLGARHDLGTIPIPALVPAGTMDRPALPVGELDPRAWAALCWRRDHLPLGRVRTRSNYEALGHLESRAAWRLASALELDADQGHSLCHHHLDRLEHLLAEAHPSLVDQRRSRESGFPVGSMVTIRSRWQRPYRFRGLRLFVGWGTWCRNRQVNLRNRWFRLRTIAYYRGAPEI